MSLIKIKKFYQDASGASAREYAILMGLIATVIISAVAISAAQSRECMSKEIQFFIR